MVLLQFLNVAMLLNIRALEFMQVFLGEVARGEKDLAVAAGNDSLKCNVYETLPGLQECPAFARTCFESLKSVLGTENA